MSQDRGTVVKHTLPDNSNWYRALLHKCIVKSPKCEGIALLHLHIVTQLKNLELAQGVIEVGRVGAAEFGLHLFDRR